MAIVLHKMVATDFASFASRMAAEFVTAMVETGELSAAEALAQSRTLVADRLPAGIASPGHELLSLFNDDAGPVGSLWLQYRSEAGRPVCVVLDVHVEPASRGRGLARETLIAAERRAAAQGATEMRLTVAGSNHVARHLYDRLGYRLLNARMGKPITPDAAMQQREECIP